MKSVQSFSIMQHFLGAINIKNYDSYEICLKGLQLQASYEGLRRKAYSRSNPAGEYLAPPNLAPKLLQSIDKLNCIFTFLIFEYIFIEVARDTVPCLHLLSVGQGHGPLLRSLGSIPPVKRSRVGLGQGQKNYVVRLETRAKNCKVWYGTVEVKRYGTVEVAKVKDNIMR